MLKIIVVVSLFVTHSIVSSEFIFKGFDDEFKPDWWQTGIIYEVYLRSFKDSNGDGIGDFNGIIEKVDYLKSINVGAVWLTPIFKSPQYDTGYDVSNFKEIDPNYGTMEDFERMKDVLHQNGIKLILDFVPNHTSDQHQWFNYSIQRKHPYTDYYVWRDAKIDEKGERQPPNNWKSLFTGRSAWEWNEERKQYYYHVFHVKQPDLNFRCPMVVEEIKNTLLYWMMRGVDGFRMDAVFFLYEKEDFSDEPLANIGCGSDDYCWLEHTCTMNQPEDPELVQSWRQFLDDFSKSENTSIFLTVECYSPMNLTMLYYGNDTSPGAHFPFNFLFVTQVTSSTPTFHLQSDAKDVADLIKLWILSMPENMWPNWVIGNHDNRRIATRIDPTLLDGFHIMQTLLPGTPTTYNGDELGMIDTFVRWDQTNDPMALAAGEFRFMWNNRDERRTPFQWDNTINAGFSNGTKTWLPVNSNYWRLNAMELSKYKSNLRTFRQLTRLRQNTSFVKGDLHLYVLSKWVLGFSRSFKDHPTFFIVINFGSDLEIVNVKAARKSLPDILKVKVSSTNSDYLTGHLVPSSHIVLKPKAALVLSTARKNEDALE